MVGTLVSEMVSQEEKEQERATSDRPESDVSVLAQPQSGQQPPQQEALLMSLTCHASNNETSCMVKEAGNHGKKIQYVLRSNPKRSRRFLDPDYNTPPFAPPVAPASTISSSMGTTNDTPTARRGPSPPSPAAITAKKPTSIFSEKARACTECGKEFHSWKALFGHMRCHPERHWRGIQPPSSSSSPSKFKSSPALKRGKGTQPRSQQGSDASGRAQCNPILDESDTESIEAAYMHERDEESPKAHKGSQFFLQYDKAMCAQSPSTDPESEVIMDEQDMADCLVMLAIAAKGGPADRPSNSYSCPGKLGQKVHSSLPLIVAEPKKAMKKRSWDKSIHVVLDAGPKAAEFDDGAGDSCKSQFQCTSCKKTFRSHQALGGHRASHKKVKGCFARTQAPEDISMPHILQETAEMTSTERILTEMQPEDTPAIPGEKGEQDNAMEEQSKRDMGQFLQFSMACHEKIEDDSAITMEKKQLKHHSSSCSSSSSVIAGTPAMAGALLTHSPQMKIHKCTVCHRVFSTGQALGGHKRCHWGSSPASNSSQKGSQDSDGGCKENPQLCLHISMSDHMSELSRKDSCTFTVDQAHIDRWSAMRENAFEQRPLFHHLDGTKEAESWLGFAMAKGDTIASRMIPATGHSNESSAAGKDPKECSQRTGYGGEQEEDPRAKGSREEGRPQKQTRSLLPKEEPILDLNLPAPEEEAEESSSVLCTADSTVLCKATLQPPYPCIFSFLAPASNSFHFEEEMANLLS